MFPFGPTPTFPWRTWLARQRLLIFTGWQKLKKVLSDANAFCIFYQFKVKINFVANACLLICASAGGWGTLVSCCLMYSFVFWCSLAWYETPGALWLGMLCYIIAQKLLLFDESSSFSTLVSRICTLKNCFCLSFSVCLLGVLTLIISWGSLGLELAVAAVSVTMATWLSS